MAVSNIRLMGVVVDRLTEYLRGEGFEVSDPFDSSGSIELGTATPEWVRVWFIDAASKGLPGIQRAIVAHIHSNGRGGVTLGLSAEVVSPVVESVLRDFSSESLAKGRQGLNRLASVDFGYFDRPNDASVIWSGGESTLEWAVAQTERLLRGPVSGWFAQFKTVQDLLTVARQPSAQSWDRLNPNPPLVRATVVVCLSHDLIADAAELMRWYIGRESFNSLDSPSQALAFDREIAARFPGYAKARTGEAADDRD